MHATGEMGQIIKVAMHKSISKILFLNRKIANTQKKRMEKYTNSHFASI